MPISISSEIKAHIQNLNLNDISLKSILNRTEIKELPNILATTEAMDNIIEGIYNGRKGVLVSTDRRLIFIDKGIFSLKVEDFPLDKITSIQYETGILMGKINMLFNTLVI